MFLKEQAGELGVEESLHDQPDTTIGFAALISLVEISLEQLEDIDQKLDNILSMSSRGKHLLQ